MPSAWLEKRPTKADGIRYRVRYAGSFRTEREAKARLIWVRGELVAKRVVL